ncbi:MAG: hypothetical protein LBS91_03520 [Clostridiales Family XIII bacterium]|jgi:hypothetical protein|nr:hypothetical protein [Clostridiales Family XIII bacterium]
MKKLQVAGVAILAVLLALAVFALYGQGQKEDAPAEPGAGGQIYETDNTVTYDPDAG